MIAVLSQSFRSADPVDFNRWCVYADDQATDRIGVRMLFLLLLCVWFGFASQNILHAGRILLVSD